MVTLILYTALIEYILIMLTSIGFFQGSSDGGGGDKSLTLDNYLWSHE